MLSVQPRPGATVKFLYMSPALPKAAAVLFEGGSGRLKFDDAKQSGFLAANAAAFVAQGIAVAVMDAPSDERDYRGGMSFTFRAGFEHRADIDAVLGALRQKLPGLPKWLVGISAGTLSAVAYAANRAEGFDGIVLLSSIVRPPQLKTQAKISVFSFPVARISVPILALAHQQDTCASTPPSGARAIVARATNSRHAQAILVTGGKSLSADPCRPPSYHTFFGIEDQVVAKVAKFILENSNG